ncbi:hypothetical protein P8C59_009555 [Phyllachora maydis]|uniref:Sm domain-containing protein n=1 Tax=Phyllachora maydis TaxID=1825666 RepID=A0AAD9ICQ9_9PEZI|nr:hypothetical protein P8C59_009555 [Phyllachora maydis]
MQPREAVLSNLLITTATTITIAATTTTITTTTIATTTTTTTTIITTTTTIIKRREEEKSCRILETKVSRKKSTTALATRCPFAQQVRRHILATLTTTTASTVSLNRLRKRDAEIDRVRVCRTARVGTGESAMADRGAHRGRGSGHRGTGVGGGFRGGRGGGRGGQGGGGPGTGHGQGGAAGERPKKENILDLAKYKDKKITVKFNGGREVTGILKGYDALMNLVLDDVQEAVQDQEGNMTTRPLGLVVARGTLLVVISPVDGSEEITNPFAQPDDK